MSEPAEPRDPDPQGAPGADRTSSPPAAGTPRVSPPPPYVPPAATASAAGAGTPPPAGYPQQPPQPTWAPPAATPGTAPNTAPPYGHLATPPAYGQPAWQPGGDAARAAGLGIVAFVVAAVAGLLVPTLGAVTGYAIGEGLGAELGDLPADSDFDLALLAPVRELILFAEITFWSGTILGIWGLVQGIVAAVTGRGRGWAIAAIVLAALGPIVYGTLVYVLLFIGLATGAMATLPTP
ncbi:hypothetical protein [Microbacterium aquimaris]|uniref:Yip1 domain-containing protein n=1 Tax=Microbacterium aquimaris TaxID=459816 RepID=A0ABU5N6W9_9MICO|nr:hypothetical protein [Microbacterium aquimaris]MDZ8161827.1 hypothetical protein [Microbacterium aquimaris]